MGLPAEDSAVAVTSRESGTAGTLSDKGITCVGEEVAKARLSADFAPAEDASRTTASAASGVTVPSDLRAITRANRSDRSQFRRHAGCDRGMRRRDADRVVQIDGFHNQKFGQRVTDPRR